MIRFFYPASRAHHAYAMCIDHGLMFETRNGFWSLEGILSVTGAADYKLVVAKECEHLLEPRDTDLVLYHEQIGENFGSEGAGPFSFVRREQAFLEGRMTVRILQRDGYPFAVPERGEL